jgi:HEAT repeat protein
MDESRWKTQRSNLFMPSMEELLAALKAENPEERIAAIIAIEQHEYDEALPEIGRVLRDDSDTGIRFQAAKTLAYFAHPATVPDLLDGLRDADMFVRVHVTGALIQIGQPAVVGLNEALNDDKAAVRRAAAKALGKIRHVDGIVGLRAAMTDADADVRRFSAQALGRIGDESTIDVLGEALRDEDGRVRKAAAGALWDMGEAALPVLREALNDPNPQTTIVAAYTLTKMGYSQPPESQS